METNGAHVIVLGNEKGGSGKSTTAFHLAIYLLYEGFSVATIDVDSRQQTLTQYVRNRRNWARNHDLHIPQTTHYHLPLSRGDSVSQNHRLEFDVFRHAVSEVESEMDFLLIDTPGFDTNLTRLSHSLADTLITPLNDSLIDLDVLAHIDPVTGEPRELSHYARLVQRARKERLAIDGRTIDWVLARNRISMLSSRNMRLVHSGIDQLATRLGARVAEGIGERVIFRSLFPIGMTVFDPVQNHSVAGSPTLSNTSATQEYKSLVSALNLPVSERAKTRNEARRAWAHSQSKGPLTFQHMSPLTS
ncbi:MAG TPA: ATPase [Devosia sp.]|nr:ATPase [Devosia sp.]